MSETVQDTAPEIEALREKVRAYVENEGGTKGFKEGDALCRLADQNMQIIGTQVHGSIIRDIITAPHYCS